MKQRIYENGEKEASNKSNLVFGVYFSSLKKQNKKKNNRNKNIPELRKIQI